jgi:hypothetical protein
MSEAGSKAETGTGEVTGLGREELHSALFAQMVMQQSNLALMLLGKVPHPESGQSLRDIDAAKLFIDQLEMLEIKTRGNLNPQESALLKQSLMNLHLAFVEAVNAPEAPAQPATPSAPHKESAAAPAEDKNTPAETAGANIEEESRKRFSKKY